MNQKSEIKNIRVLGVDYGRVKVGLALGEGGLAQPLSVIRYKDINELVGKIGVEIKKEKIEKIVVGISEGVMEKESKDFSKNLRSVMKIPVETFDETLSTQDAQELSRQAGINRKKRHEMEDAYAASIMLQNYLDNK